MTNPVHVETNGYLLRSLCASDITPRFLQWLNDKDVQDGLNVANMSFSLEQMRAYVEQFDNLHNYILGIFDQSNGLLIGFYTMDVSLVHKTGNITVALGEKDYYGKGVLWKTTEALLDHFYAYRDLEKITARILAKNRRMLFNLIGAYRFTHEAVLRKECRAATGERLDVLIFASFKTDSVYRQP